MHTPPPRLDVLGVLHRDLLLVRDVEERLLPRDLGLALLLGDRAKDDVHRLERETLGLGEEESEGERDDVDDGKEEELGRGSAAAALRGEDEAEADVEEEDDDGDKGPDHSQCRRWACR
jgi:hypothetical protein